MTTRNDLSAKYLADIKQNLNKNKVFGMLLVNQSDVNMIMDEFAKTLMFQDWLENGTGVIN